MGRACVGQRGELHCAGFLGAAASCVAGSPWLDAAVVVSSAGLNPPVGAPQPLCVWSADGPVAGRVAAPALTMPALGLHLSIISGESDDPLVEAARIEAPSLADIGVVNEAAYGDVGSFQPLIAHGLADPRIETHGLRRVTTLFAWLPR